MTGVLLGNIFSASILKKKKKMSSAWLLSKTWRNYPFEMKRTLLSFYTNQLIINILSPMFLLFDGNENPWYQRITQTYRDRWHYKGQTIIFFDTEGWRIFTCKHLFHCLQPLQTIYFKIFQLDDKLNFTMQPYQ